MLNLNARGRAALTQLTVTCARPGCASRFTFTVGDADDLRAVAALAGWHAERRGTCGPAARLILDYCPECKPGRGVPTGVPYTLNLNARGCTTLKPLTIGCDTPGCHNRFTFTVGDFDDLRAAAALAGWYCERRRTSETGDRQVVDHCPACTSALSQRDDAPLGRAPADAAAIAKPASSATPTGALEPADRPLGPEPTRPVIISMTAAAPTPADSNGQLPS